MLLILESMRAARAARVAARTPALEVPAGRFCVTPGGLRAELRAPLGRLSGEYPWAAVPLGIATLRLLILAEGGSGELVTRVVKRFHISNEDQDLYDEAVGKVWVPNYTVEDEPHLVDTNPWVVSVFKITDWCSHVMSEACADSRSVATMDSLATMNDGQLERYVTSYLG